MTVTYSDPWKDNPYGKFKGDKKDAFIQLHFDECKFYKHENAYYLAGHFTAFGGVIRAFGSDPINPGLCELPIYGSEYEIRQKKEGTGQNGTKKEYETVKVQPSIAEKLLYQHIEENPSKYLEEGKAYKGSITFYPDANYASMTDDDVRLNHVLQQVNVEPVEPSGNYADWTPPKSYGSGNGSYSKGVSLEDKLTFLKEQLAEGISDSVIRNDKNLPLPAYVHKVIEENNSNERFLVCYFDLLKALVS